MSIGLLGAGPGVAGGGGAPAFSPPSSASIWIENDPTKLYTDAGTTLVSADGQAVYRAASIGGLTRYLEQPSAANRPLYKDAANDYLLFDGSNDGLTSGTAATVDASGQCWLAFVGQLADVTTNQHIACIRSTVGEQLRLYVAGGNLQTYSGTTTGGGPMTSASPATNTKFVIICQLTTTQLLSYYNNGSAVSTSVSGALDLTNSRVTLGSNDGAANFTSGQVRGFGCGSGILTGTERGDIYARLNAL